MSTPANVELAIEGVILSRVGADRAIRGREVVSILRAAGHRCHLRRVVWFGALDDLTTMALRNGFSAVEVRP